MKINFLKSIFVSCFLSATSSSQISDYKVSEYNSKQGLSQSVINSIVQDSRGFIWVGTQDGLNKFDGYKFKIYKQDLLD
ncbi:MAG: two-component regulator propeller domain-containing protein, partial [Bacteroidota bacterium]